MSEKKAAPPPPKPKAPPPSKGSSGLPVLLSVIVLLIAAVCVARAVSDPLFPHLFRREPQSQTETTETQEDPAFDPSLLILVSPKNPLPENFSVALAPMADWPLYVAEAALNDLQAMLYDGISEGYYFQVLSAYRDEEEQLALYEEKVAQYLQQGYTRSSAELEASMYEQKPGQSEYETGLAVDIVSASYQHKDTAQETTAETQWLHEHCHEYGFILRHPIGKTSETGIPYEPWHYRYVGREAAKFLTEHNLTLEGYWAAYGAD